MSQLDHFVAGANDITVLVSLLAVFYWANFIGKNKDERGYKVMGKASIFSFAIITLLVGFSMLFNITGQIQNDVLKEYLIFTYTTSMIVFSALIFVFNRRMV